MSILGKTQAEQILRGKVSGYGGMAEVEPLTFTGAVEAVYDGKNPLAVNIPREVEIDEVVQEVLEQMPESTVTVIVTETKEQVAKDIPNLLYGKWVLIINYDEPMGTIEQEVKFKTNLAIYRDAEGNLLTAGNEDQIVSYHEATCSKMVLDLQKGAASVTYTVESTDAELQAVLDAQGSNDVLVFMGVLMANKWFPKNAKYVEFIGTQEVTKEFSERFKVVAKPYYGEDALIGVKVTEAADGTVTMVNTLSSGDETIVIGADESGNPNKLTYNGKEIPVDWVVEA